MHYPGKWLTYFYIVQGLRLSRTDAPVTSDIPVLHRDLKFLMKDIRTVKLSELGKVQLNGTHSFPC